MSTLGMSIVDVQLETHIIGMAHAGIVAFLGSSGKLPTPRRVDFRRPGPRVAAARLIREFPRVGDVNLAGGGEQRGVEVVAVV